MHRATDVDELLDGPLPDADVLAGNLRDLSRANQWFGGTDLSARAIATLVGDTTDVSLLDVGTGAADIPLALLDRAGRAGRHWTVTGLDSRSEVLAAAAMVDPRVSAMQGLTLRVGDGRRLPFPDRSFDVAHASLVVHHLDPDDVVAVLLEMRRVARVGVVINDLVRSRVAWGLAWAFSHGLTRNPFTRHDATLSVDRAYTRSELVGLLDRAGLTVEGRVVGFAGHRWAVAARPIGSGR
jgi:SAM-dependent methyltransferase